MAMQEMSGSWDSQHLWGEGSHSNLPKNREPNPAMFPSLPLPKPISPHKNFPRSSSKLFLPSYLWRREYLLLTKDPTSPSSFQNFLHWTSSLTSYPSCSPFLLFPEKLFECEIPLITFSSVPSFTLHATFPPPHSLLQSVACDLGITKPPGHLLCPPHWLFCRIQYQFPPSKFP